MKLFLGVDPGLEGALAVVNGDGRVVDVRPMPLIQAIGGTGRDTYDLEVIRDLLLLWKHDGLFATVERLQPLPPRIKGPDGKDRIIGGSIANFNRGLGRGWEWMFTALKIPYQAAAPRVWQKPMHLGTPEGTTKARSILAAHRLFPGVSLKRTGRSRTESDGIAEALLLAEFGRRSCDPRVIKDVAS